MNFTEQDLEARVRPLVETLDTKPGILFGLVRVMLTGGNIAPGLFETMHVLGKEKTLSRLK
jgi:glutamyl-tRNA synthetase